VLTKDQLLAPLAARRTDQTVVTTMSMVRPWGPWCDPSLDLASADSAMGHAADVALGLAMAQPSRRVVCLNGDGSMLMSLGTLATIVEAGVTNLVLFVVANDVYELTGCQAVPGGGRLSFADLARAAGFPRVYRIHDPEAYEASLDEILLVEGPVLVEVSVQPGTEGPISRSAAETAAYLKTSLFDACRTLRASLIGGPDPGPT
jgi:thiamine pyrophosphate-dependent acetolactate synthase large subunit-like protein